MEKNNFKLPDTQTVDNKVTKVITVILIIGLFLLVICAILMASALMPYDKNDTNKREFKVEPGWGSSMVVEKLAEEHYIKNPLFVKIYLKMNPENNIKEGTYYLSSSMDVTQIFDILSSNDSVENETFNIRLIEGKQYKDYIDQIADTFKFDKEELLAKYSNKEFLQTLIDKYWFITDEILNEKIKYPLEGYIFPDYYNIRKTATMEDVLYVFLDEMGNKLTPYKDDITASGKSVHSLLSLASMIELEAGDEKTDINGVSVFEREIVSGIFNNRLKIGMKLGSDVTTYYAVDKKLQQSLTVADLNSCNGYNTRGECVPGIPVGPICSPSLLSIVSAIKPADINYLYFVADKNGKLYFAVDQVGHDKNISYLKEHDLWL